MKLNDLKLYEEAIITKLDVKEDIKKRLMSIGFINGAKIKPVINKKLIRAYMVKETIIAVRTKDTKYIEVKI